MPKMLILLFFLAITFAADEWELTTAELADLQERLTDFFNTEMRTRVLKRVDSLVRLPSVKNFYRAIGNMVDTTCVRPSTMNGTMISRMCPKAARIVADDQTGTCDVYFLRTKSGIFFSRSTKCRVGTIPLQQLPK
ncbi:hypothetical protein M514_05171 [Trichuris suis]|nr:hypothetical protein M514_05171 [Trichuris suis]